MRRTDTHHYLVVCWGSSLVVICWKYEFRGMERTDVIRTTSSAFRIRKVGSESAILALKLVSKENDGGGGLSSPAPAHLECGIYYVC